MGLLLLLKNCMDGANDVVMVHTPLRVLENTDRSTSSAPKHRPHQGFIKGPAFCTSGSLSFLVSVTSLSVLWLSSVRLVLWCIPGWQSGTEWDGMERSPQSKVWDG